MIPRPSPSILFIYGLWMALVIASERDLSDLLLLFFAVGVPGMVLGARRAVIVVYAVLVGSLGVFINSLIIANTGVEVARLGPLVVREGAVDATLSIVLRILALSGTGLLFIGLTTPRTAIRSLEEELRLPKGLAFSVAFALRMLPLIRRDFEEVRDSIRQKRDRRIPLAPSWVFSILAPMMSISLERALWVGIAAELRGFRLRKKRRRLRVGPVDLALIALGLALTFESLS